MRLLFFRDNKTLGIAAWLVIISVSYWSGRGVGPDPALASTALEEPAAVATTPAPTSSPTPPPATPTPTPPPTVTAVPTTPQPAPAAVRVARTSYPNNYYYGFCTWYVASRRPVPPNWGNAGAWLASARAAGWRTGTAPAAGAIAWTYGHVAYVERVQGSQVYLSEMNYNGNWGRVTYRLAPASSFVYIY
jgi:peptidoglycan DL-endopeptidase CwlO